MKSEFDVSFFLIVGSVLLANIFFIKVKKVLKANGYPVNYFYGSVRDLINMSVLIKKEENEELKKSYRILYLKVVITFLLFIGIVVYKISA